MCGRYALSLPPEVVRALFGYADLPNFPPRYNIAPTQPVPVVVVDGTARRFVLMRWGFLPAWVKDPKEFPLVFNIRSETAAEKPAFRNALRRRRAIMPADAFYEWRRVGRASEPYLVRRPDRALFGFAALHETWASKDGSEIDTVAILTTEANATLAAIHPRCPVILDEREFERWLDSDESADAARAVLKPPPEDLLEIVRIGDAINKVANDGASVQAPWETGVERPAERAPKPPPKKAVPKKPPDDDDQGSLF